MGICVSKVSAEVLDPKDHQEEEEPMELSLKEGFVAPFYTTFSSNSSFNLTDNTTAGNWGESNMISFSKSQDADTDFNFFDNLLEDEYLAPLLNDGYKIIKVLGKGACAQVYELEKGGKKFAVKVCIINDTTVNFLNHDTHQPKEEAAILRNFNHPYVIKIYDIIENKVCVYIIMELLPCGTILTLTDKKQQKLAFAQICAALEYIHSLDFAHRDIKCENTLMAENKVAKLCDFGISEYIRDPKVLTSHKMKGTPAYCAPEVFSSDPYDLKIADIWSLGVLLYVLEFRSLPFTGKNLFELKVNIEESEPNYPVDADPNLVSLLKGILMKSPDQRFTIAQIWESEWMKGLEKTVKSSSSFVPTGVPVNIFTRKNSIRYASTLISQ